MNVLIADDHAVLREGIKSLLNSLGTITGIDEAVNGSEALAKIKNNDYDLVILDISMPGNSGLDILRQIKATKSHIRPLVISFYPESQYAARAFKLGAVGYISKGASFAEIKKAIRKVSEGGRYVSPEFAEKLAFANNIDLAPHERLSEREFQIMIMLAKGESATAIARQLFISEKTVSTYRSRVMKKMDLNNNAELTIYAMQNGLIV